MYFEKSVPSTEHTSKQGSGDGTKEIARRRGSGIPSLEIQLDICKLERQQARYEARGRLSPSLICPQSSVVCPLNADSERTEAQDHIQLL
ncbi:hypothetical protein GS511_09980 [Leptospira borgpetersenii]|nr:hypothetical protein GS524_09980 [Leptospira borgpetersenii]QHE31809.1 hypothetical protein GS523_09990 [Leptospira borgpetersenii]QHE35105.1 hypothetical protein GS517_09985 [Leptospira borgpetersenii]QHE38338.1 hypothetical protein GS510_09635 [Leptospira borgpetersenii]QHE41655.1 hypothetical protein GS527_10265 [Leptospira borgpetersenii]